MSQSSAQPRAATVPVAVPDSISEFHPFPCLPLEVRDTIWAFSLPDPRIIPIRAERGTIHVPGRHGQRPFVHVWVPQKVPVPALLHTCHGSRRIALKHYELAFDSNARPAREDLPDLHNLPPMRRGRDLVFPFEKKALVYVDLERDIFLTSHRRDGYRSDGKLLQDDPRFKKWPCLLRKFQVGAFRDGVPREIYSRIRTLAADFIFSIREIFEPRIHSDMMSIRQVLVIRDPFQRGANGRDYIDGCYSARIPKPRDKGKLRALRDLRELMQTMKDGTLWDWAVSEEFDTFKTPLF